MGTRFRYGPVAGNTSTDFDKYDSGTIFSSLDATRDTSLGVTGASGLGRDGTDVQLR